MANPNNKAHLAVEMLETRNLMAAGILSSVEYRANIKDLTITGSNANERVSIALVNNGNTVRVQVDDLGNDNIVDNTRIVEIARSKVGSISYNGNGGNDFFSNQTSIGGVILGGTGNDTLLGGSGRDIIYAGDGHDLVSAGAGNDLVFAGEGNDTVVGSLGNDTIHGEGGNDDLRGQAGDDLLTGGAGNDRMAGDGGNDFLRGDAGRDIMFGDTDAIDQVFGGNDTLLGGDGDDEMHGGAGHDRMEGGNGNDSMFGGSGNDTLLGQGGADLLHGMAGNDRLDGGYDRIRDSCFGGAGNDLFIQHRSLIRGSDNDLFFDFVRGLDRIDTHHHL